MIIAQSPCPDLLRHPTSVFLAGSITGADNWQQKVADEIATWPIEGVIFNPRRKEWAESDPSNVIDKDRFSEQVNWELDRLIEAKFALFNFVPGTLAPITLTEFGVRYNNLRYAGVLAGERNIVVCPKGFWRRGNVEIMCDRHGISMYDEMEFALLELKQKMVGNK